MLSLAESSDCGLLNDCSSAVCSKDIEETCSLQTAPNFVKPPAIVPQTFKTDPNGVMPEAGIPDPDAQLPVSPQGSSEAGRFLRRPFLIRGLPTVVSERTDPLSEYQKKYPKYPLGDKF